MVLGESPLGSKRDAERPSLRDGHRKGIRGRAQKAKDAAEKNARANELDGAGKSASWPE